MKNDLIGNNRVAIFGCGHIFKVYEDIIKTNFTIQVFIDNDINNHDKMIEGCVCIFPREVHKYDIDLIILMSASYLEMKNQLLNCGCDEKKIICYRDVLGLLCYSQKRYCSKVKYTTHKKKNNILIISNELRYNGAPIVVYRTSRIAIQLGYDVTVAASEADARIIEDFINCGVDVIIQENLKYAAEENLFWTKEYGVILVNTFVMGLCATRISKHQKVLWWLHENSDVYPEMDFWYNQIRKEIVDDNIGIFAVSERAKENFLRFFPTNKVIKPLVVGIEDWRTDRDVHNKDGITFAIIGGMIPRKGHNVLLNAINKMRNIDKVNFIFIGERTDDNYGKTIINGITRLNNSVIYGEITQEKIKKIYQEIDVVIVPSLEETFSMAAAEAMMMGKVCIVSDCCGISEYIKNGENGLVFPSKDFYRLSYLMDWCIENNSERLKIGERARLTYEKYFSLQIFEKNLNKVLTNLEK